MEIRIAVLLVRFTRVGGRGGCRRLRCRSRRLVRRARSPRGRGSWPGKIIRCMVTPTRGRRRAGVGHRRDIDPRCLECRSYFRASAHVPRGCRGTLLLLLVDVLKRLEGSSEWGSLCGGEKCGLLAGRCARIEDTHAERGENRLLNKRGKRWEERREASCIGFTVSKYL